jgi:hypothetical protein
MPIDPLDAGQLAGRLSVGVAAVDEHPPTMAAIAMMDATSFLVLKTKLLLG